MIALVRGVTLAATSAGSTVRSCSPTHVGEDRRRALVEPPRLAVATKVRSGHDDLVTGSNAPQREPPDATRRCRWATAKHTPAAQRGSPKNALIEHQRSCRPYVSHFERSTSRTAVSSRSSYSRSNSGTWARPLARAPRTGTQRDDRRTRPGLVRSRRGGRCRASSQRFGAHALPRCRECAACRSGMSRRSPGSMQIDAAGENA